jgi:hypothetical protein
MLSRSMSVTLDGVSVWILDRSTTYTRDSELQVITAQPLIPTIHKSPKHPLSIFQPARVFTSRSLVTASSSGDSSATPIKSALNGGSLVFLITPRHGLRRQHRSFSYSNRFRGNVFIEPFPSRGRLFLLTKNLLPSKRRNSFVCFVAIA